MVITGDTKKCLKDISTGSIDCVITSPPYYALRIYDHADTVWDGDPDCSHEWQDDTYSLKMLKKIPSKRCKKCNAWYGQLGCEKTPEQYIKHLADIFDEVYRVLSSEGNCFINIADTYGQYGNLLLIPDLLCIELAKRGWIIKDKIIWAKKCYVHNKKQQFGNGIPESAKNKFTSAYEVVIHAVKAQSYFFKKLKLNKKINSIDRNFCGTYHHKYAGINHYGGGAGINECRPNYKFIQKSLVSEPLALFDLPKQTQKIQFNSKFLSSEKPAVNNKSIAGRVIQGIKINYKLIQDALQTVNQYLKTKLKESPYNINQLADILNVSTDTLSHYFRTDLSGCAIPTEDIWNAMKPLLNLDEYHERIKKEYTTVLPVISPYAYMCNVLQVNTTGLKDLHYSAYPEELVRILIEAGTPYRTCNHCGHKLKEASLTCPECGSKDLRQSIVLDPFLGSGTTALVAEKTGRKWIGIEISESYTSIIRKRTDEVQLELIH